MRRPVAAVVVAAALVVACAPATERGATGRGAQRASDPALETTRSDLSTGAESLPEEPAPGDVLMVLLPGADRSAGAVLLRHGERELLVEDPFAAATIAADGAVKVSRLRAAAVARQFGAALAALPPRPAVFTLYFSEGKNRFTEGSLARLEELLTDLAKRPAPEISITGHSDTAGPESVNDRLSLARARRAREQLVRRGIPAAHIVSVAGRGERELLVPTADGVPEPRNRRVEISVR
jgi:outer membrane protein OmpA-like peptidoglycan-associated protein